MWTDLGGLVSRLEILRRDIAISDGRGLEIGPLNAPVVTHDMGSVFYADHASTDELRTKYAPNPKIPVQDIVPVDFVWGEQTLPEAVGDEAPFDYVVASHVLEHVPDLIGWLSEIRSILRPGGRLSLALPDRRYTFDVRRRDSDISELVEAYLLRLRRPAPRATFDHFYRHVDVDTGAIWDGQPGHDAPPPNSARAMELTIRSVSDGMYVDTHCWVFSDRVFVELMHTAMSLGLVDLRFVSFTPTRPGDFEFFVTLERPASDESAEESLQKNLASVPFIPPPAWTADAPPITGNGAHSSSADRHARPMLVSDREQRLLELKRSTLLRARSTVARLRRR